MTSHLFEEAYEMAQIDRHEKLPGSDRSAYNLGCDGASVGLSKRQDNPGGKHITVWNGSESNERFSYEVDKFGEYVPGTAYYTDTSAERLWRDMFGNRW